jgi:hypothetical protein
VPPHETGRSRKIVGGRGSPPSVVVRADKMRAVVRGGAISQPTAAHAHSLTIEAIIHESNQTKGAQIHHHPSFSHVLAACGACLVWYETTDDAIVLMHCSLENEPNARRRERERRSERLGSHWNEPHATPTVSSDYTYRGATSRRPVYPTTYTPQSATATASASATTNSHHE